MADINTLVFEDLINGISGNGQVRGTVDPTDKMNSYQNMDAAGKRMAKSMTPGQYLDDIKNKFNSPGMFHSDNPSIANQAAKAASSVTSGAGEVKNTISPNAMSGSGIGNMAMGAVKKLLPGQQ